MSGIFHSFKKSLGKGGDARPDMDFVDAKARFEQYQDVLLKLKGNVANYLTHATALFVSSAQITQDFATLLDDGALAGRETGPHEYSELAASMRSEHQSLAQEQSGKLQHSFSTTLLSEIDAECVRNSELSKRVARRIEVFSELGYYQKKVNELRDERAARASKGKTESASDTDKFERNQKKLQEYEVMFHEINGSVMSDLHQVWDAQRIAKMGPLLQRFLQHERKLADAYTATLANIKDKGFVTP